MAILKTTLNKALLLGLGLSASTAALAQDTLIIADAYVDVAKGKTIKDAAVIVSLNQITKITKQADIKNRNDFILIDLSGKP